MSILKLNSEYNTISYNIIRTGTVIASAPNNTLNNCTFAASGFLDVNATLTVNNCIFDKKANVSLASGVSLIANYCCFNFTLASLTASGGSVVSTHCLWDTDPVFKWSGNLHLAPNSPCRNVGTLLFNTASDFDGVSVIGTPDIGALEYVATRTSATFYVRPVGDIEFSGDGTSYKDPTSVGAQGAWRGFSRIEWGSDDYKLGPGDRLYVCGTHDELLTIGDSGNSASGNIVISGNYASEAGYIVNSTGRGIYSNGKGWITIASLGIYRASDDGMYIQNASHFEILDCVVASNHDFGMYFYGGSKINIQRTRSCRNTDTNIHLYVTNSVSASITISSVTATDGLYYGIRFNGSNANYNNVWCSTILIENCILKGNSNAGLALVNARNVTIKDSVVSTNCQDANSYSMVIYGKYTSLHTRTWSVYVGSTYQTSMATHLYDIVQTSDTRRWLTVGASAGGLSNGEYYLATATLYMNVGTDPTTTPHTYAIQEWCDNILIKDVKSMHTASPTNTWTGAGMYLNLGVRNANVVNCETRDIYNSGFRIISCKDITLSNCISCESHARGLFLDNAASSIRILNCLAFDCQTDGIRIDEGSTASIYNTIVASCGDKGIDRATDGVFTEKYNCFWDCNTAVYGGVIDTTSTIANPDFVYQDGCNFHLTFKSPCIGIGSNINNLSSYLASDFDGVGRTGKWDMGPYDQKSAGWTYSDQYNTGQVSVHPGSKIVVGNTDVNWTAASAAIKPNDLFRLNTYTAPYYKIASILSATKIKLSEKIILATALTGYPYMITRHLTACRGYAYLYQGDEDFANVSKEQLVDAADEDIGNIIDGSASLLGLRIVNNRY